MIDDFDYKHWRNKAKEYEANGMMSELIFNVNVIEFTFWASEGMAYVHRRYSYEDLFEHKAPHTLIIDNTFAEAWKLINEKLESNERSDDDKS